MKRLYNILIIIPIFLLFFVSCYYDNEEALYPTIDSSCDTIFVTYGKTIVPIMNNNCYACHSNKTAPMYGNNIPLETYADVVANSVQITKSIKHIGPLPPMPKNGSMLKSCSITQWDIWIRKGMPNN
jgi:hypothetical protein